MAQVGRLDNWSSPSRKSQCHREFGQDRIGKSILDNAIAGKEKSNDGIARWLL